MHHIKLPSFLQSLLLPVLLAFSQLAWAGVVVAGQEIGKATWADRTLLATKKFKVAEDTESPLKQGKVLRVEGPLSGKLAGSAELFYDAQGTLAGARITSAQPRDMLKRLAQTSRAHQDGASRYTSGALHLRIVQTDRADLVYVTSPALDAQLAASQARKTASGPASWWNMGLWLVPGAACMMLLQAVVRFAWRRRLKIWDARAFIADYLAAFAITGAVAYAYPEAKLGLQKVALGAYLLGYGLLLVWALRTVRHSGWLPRKPVLELLWAIPATPVLLVPVIVRNACKSVHYAGMTLFFAQIFALVYVGWQPGLAGILLVLALTGLFGAGLARLYCASWERFDRRHSAVRILLTLLLWPVFLAVFCVYMVFRTIVGALFIALYMAIPAILVWLVGAMTETQWLQTVAGCMPFLGLVPGVFNVFAMGITPTGYSGMDFNAESFNPATGLPMMGGFDTAGNGYGMGGFDINPANGMLMVGGIGGFDTFGNSFGVDDHHY